MNELQKESSPYLLQHVDNPVHWKTWNPDSVQKAVESDRLMIVSIGYSSCHWCHVMAHESFEDEEVAEQMNASFINVKIDREEHPDVDQIYMNAVHLMRGQGGWPLNVVCLPDGRPIWGGTYFPKKEWLKNLSALQDIWLNQREKVFKYAEQLENGLIQMEQIVAVQGKTDFEDKVLIEMINTWSNSFDSTNGGMKRPPKFPMPNNYLFLLRMAALSDNSDLMSFVERSLSKMHQGGIYDQLKGGFARYSTDVFWKVPHFEKMLYDNAQLIALYSEAFAATKNEAYKEVVNETIAFIDADLCTSNGLYQSALDADTEGEEGKFYTWDLQEIEEAIDEEDLDLFKDFFKIEPRELWEGRYVLQLKMSISEFASSRNLAMDELKRKLEHWKMSLLKLRETRIKPGLDDKSLCSWNGLMIDALVSAYVFTANTPALEKAENLVKQMELAFLQSDGSLLHSYKDGHSKINGFLDDYCFFIQGYLRMYEATFNEDYLQKAKTLLLYTLDYFVDDRTGFFYYTSRNQETLVTRSIEKEDNVIPSSNSCMAQNLFKLGKHFDNKKFIQIAKAMLARMEENMNSYPMGYSNWAILHSWFSIDHYEIVFSGSDAQHKMLEFERNHYYPNKLIAGNLENSSLALCKDRYQDNKTLIHICTEGSCRLPVDNIKDAVEQLA